MVRSIISNRGGVALNGQPYAAGDTVRWVPRKGVVSVAKFRSAPEDRGDSSESTRDECPIQRAERRAEMMMEARLTGTPIDWDAM